MFVDHAGQTVAVIDRLTGESRDAYVFVAVLGASNYTYAGATWTRTPSANVIAHSRAGRRVPGRAGVAAVGHAAANG